MIRVALAAGLWMLVAVPAMAQVVSVRSGEHGDFTRLAFDMSSATGWTILGTQDPRRFLLRFAEPIAAADASRVFSRIDRRRLSDIAWRDDLNAFELSLGCDCAPSEFMHTDRMLVLDLRPGQWDGPRETIEPATARAAPGMPDPRLAAFRRVTVADLPRIGPPLRTPDGPLRFSAQPFPEPSPDDRQPAVDLNIAETVRREAVAGRLTSALPREALRDAGSSGAAPDPARTVAPQPQEGGIARLEDRDRVRLSQQDCASEDHLVAWSADTEMGNLRVFDRRAAVFSEFDGIEPRAMLDYADALIAAGFGAEARALDRLPEFDLPRSRRALSYLVDGEPDPTGYFRGMTHCRNQAQIWAALSASSSASAVDMEMTSLLQSFELLPTPLRAHLGPRLAARLLEFGFPEAARDIGGRLERLRGGETTELALLESEIDVAEGAAATALDRLDTVESVSAGDLPKVLRSRVSAAFSAGQTIDEETVATVALLFEERDPGSEGASDTALAYLRALVASGRFDDGRRLLTGAGQPLAENQRRGRTDYFDRLATDATDIVFLREYMNVTDEARALTGPRQVMGLARRLSDLGMAAEALDLLANGAIPDEDPDRRLLEARLLFATGQMAEAEALVLTLDSPEARALRGEIRAAVGDFEAASATFADLGEDEKALRTAWLASSWDMVAQRDSALSDAASLAAAPQARLPDRTERLTLSELETLVAESDSARKTLATLLQETEAR